MGCYDSVMVPCPKCGERSEFQSKSGECLCREYMLEDCPEEVLGDVNRHAPNICGRCHTEYYVQFNPVPRIWNRSKKEDV